MMKGHKRWILLPVLFIHVYSGAQIFAWKSELDTVPQSGFYNISLSLDWLVHLKTDLSDIRIKDGENGTVPFILKKYPSGKNSSFINFPILKNTTDSIATTLELDASKQLGTDHLCLVVGNNAVERFASLSGSDDKSQWFIIDEKLTLTNRSGYVDDRSMQWLSFPFIRYPYLKLKINNKGTDPLPVLRAGIYTDTSVKEYLPLYLQPGTTFRQKDSTDGHTYIWVHNEKAYPVDRISMELSGPRFYKRPLRIYSVEENKRQNLLGTGEVRSGEDPAIWLMGGKAQNLLVIIENGDNPPLKINAVNTQCRRHELIAYLEKGKKYMLLGGNEAVHFPGYDLALFRDSIPLQVNDLKHGSILSNSEEHVSLSSNKRWWIWPAIAAMIILLSFLTYRLMGEMKSEKM